MNKLKKFFCLSLLVIFASQLLIAQKEGRDFHLDSPHDALLTHLKYLDEENYRPDIAAKVFMRDNISEREARIAAIKLYQYYNAKGYFIEFEKIPRNPDYIDSVSKEQRFYPVPLHKEIFVEKVGDNWFYSDETIGEINRLHKQAFPWGSDKLLNLLPKIGQQKVMGLHLWQLVGLLSMILISFILHFIFTWLINEFFYRMLELRGYHEIGRKYLLPVARPVSYFVLTLVALIFVRVLQLPISMAHVLIVFLGVLTPFFGALTFYRLVDVLGLYMERLAERTENTLDDQLVPLVRKSLKFFVILVGFLVILREGLNIDIWPIITGISIGGLALALAAQDTLKNFFGSLMIFIDKPFQIGQFIQSGEIEGTVEEVGFRSTRVRTVRNSVMYVPNAKLADSVIDNWGLRQYRRYSTTISITYDTPAEMIELFVEGLREIALTHPEVKKDTYYIHFNALGSSSLDIVFTVFLEVPGLLEEFIAREQMLLDIVRLADVLKVRFAFPTQTLFVEEIPGQVSLTPNFNESKDELRKKLYNFLQETRKQNEKPD
ncbi:MAG: mechanosensitive ion channel family protein [Flavobacteriales bacterium]